ncbi:MAG: hypothetical protein ACE5JI_03765 [Acidobacteriota bacterium]
MDPYKTKMASKVRFIAKRPVKASFVVRLEGTIENRGLELISPGSRCVRKGEIFELICTAEGGAKPGGRVDSATYLGFCEVVQSGVIRANDLVEINGKHYGRVGGFDETHAPNHLNVVLKVASGHIPPSFDIQLGDAIAFTLDHQSQDRRFP